MRRDEHCDLMVYVETGGFELAHYFNEAGLVCEHKDSDVGGIGELEDVCSEVSNVCGVADVSEHVLEVVDSLVSRVGITCIPESAACALPSGITEHHDDSISVVSEVIGRTKGQLIQCLIEVAVVVVAIELLPRNSVP